MRVLGERIDLFCSGKKVSAKTQEKIGKLEFTVAGARTTGDVLLTLAGLTNAAAANGIVGDAPAEKERLFALAPDVFVVGRPDRSESAPPSAEFLLGDPALAALPAVRDRRIVALPPQLFTTASPELLRGAEVLVDELLALEER